MKHVLTIPLEWDGDIYLIKNLATRVMHHHRELEFNLVTRGTGTYLLDDRIYELQRHALLWLFPEQEHLLLQHSGDFQMWIGVFRPELLHRVCTTSPTRPLLALNPTGHFCRWLQPQQTERLTTLFEEIVARRDQTPLFNAGLAYGILSAWNAFATATEIPPGQDVHPAVEKASRLIRENPADCGSLADIARQSGLSTSRLSRLFKQQAGLSIVDFRNRQRLNRFFDLYGSGQRMTMLAAALEAGFGSYPQFHRVFKKLTQTSPAKHRRTRSK